MSSSKALTHTQKSGYGLGFFGFLKYLQYFMSGGANHKIRCLGITPDLALIDPCFIRLCQQHYHFRLGNEPNAKKRFRAYYGLDWCRIAQTLDVGYSVYVNKEKIEVWKIPMFQKVNQRCFGNVEW
jgi:hypothetical protein